MTLIEKETGKCDPYWFHGVVFLFDFSRTKIVLHRLSLRQLRALFCVLSRRVLRAKRGKPYRTCVAECKLLLIYDRSTFWKALVSRLGYHRKYFIRGISSREMGKKSLFKHNFRQTKYHIWNNRKGRNVLRNNRKGRNVLRTGKYSSLSMTYWIWSGWAFSTDFWAKVDIFLFSKVLKNKFIWNNRTYVYSNNSFSTKNYCWNKDE